MSPTATIAAVVAALVFLAWIFQSDVTDPAYEAWAKRQAEEKKVEGTVRPPLGVNITDAGVTKGGSPEVRGSREYTSGTENVVPASFPQDAVIGDNSNVPTTQPLNANGNAFSANAHLQGTYVGVMSVGDVPRAAPVGEEPWIAFRRDGTFSTQNMHQADVDMEAGTLGASSSIVERSRGNYHLGGNALSLQYTDGLNRKKGNTRNYTVTAIAIAGPAADQIPAAITIQGKMFKLDPTR